MHPNFLQKDWDTIYTYNWYYIKLCYKDFDVTTGEDLGTYITFGECIFLTLIVMLDEDRSSLESGHNRYFRIHLAAGRKVVETDKLYEVYMWSGVSLFLSSYRCLQLELCQPGLHQHILLDHYMSTKNIIWLILGQFSFIYYFYLLSSDL